MSLQPFDRRVPAHGDSLHDHDDSLSRTSIRAKLRAKLNTLIGRALRAWQADFSLGARRADTGRTIRHRTARTACRKSRCRPTNGSETEASNDGWPRLRDNQRALRAAYRETIEAVREERTITPAANWLLDNFHVVEEQVREIRVDLPSSFYRQLPKLREGPLEGYPRVFGLAWAFVAHTDSHFDAEMLRRFASAYQRVQPLTIGELWAIPITLRIVLVENLRRLGRRHRGVSGSTSRSRWAGGSAAGSRQPRSRVTGNWPCDASRNHCERRSPFS